MTRDLLQAIYEALPKQHLEPYYGVAAANVAAYRYLLATYGDSARIAAHVANHVRTGYVEYDVQYANVLTAYLGATSV